MRRALKVVQFCDSGRTLEIVPLPYPSTDELPESASARVRTACILVNWNGADDTLACLRALEQQTERDFAVFVVDNGSTDDSLEHIAEYLRERPAEAVPMQLLEAGANLGFSGGNNVGIRAAAALQPEFVWLLNNDTVAPPETLALLLSTADTSPDAGLVGSVLYYMHDPARVQAWGGGRMRPSIAYASHYCRPHVFGAGDYLTFASVLVRTDLLREVGLLDERFFMYYEDAELCLRAQQAGWGLAVAAKTAVLHKEGGSRSIQRSQPLEATRTISALTLIDIHGQYPLAGRIIFLAARIGKKLLRLRWNEVPAVISAARTFYRGEAAAKRL